jgi:hypothetical protein
MANLRYHRDKPPSPGAASMPLTLTADELQMLNALAAPIDANRRPEFMQAVTTRLEASPAAAIGPGTLHRAARAILGGGFWEPPRDLRHDRIGPRGPRG